MKTGEFWSGAVRFGSTRCTGGLNGAMLNLHAASSSYRCWISETEKNWFASFLTRLTNAPAHHCCRRTDLRSALRDDRRDANLQQFLWLFLMMLICNNVWNIFSDCLNFDLIRLMLHEVREHTLKLLWLIKLNDHRINYQFVKKVCSYFHNSDCRLMRFESFCITVFIVIGQTSKNHNDIN